MLPHPSPLHPWLQAYQQGWSASEIFTQLRDQDFMQSGGLVPVTMPSFGGAAETAAGSGSGAAGIPDDDRPEQPAVPAELLRKDVNKQLFST